MCLLFHWSLLLLIRHYFLRNTRLKALRLRLDGLDEEKKRVAAFDSIVDSDLSKVEARIQIMREDIACLQGETRGEPSSEDLLRLVTK